MDSPIQLSFFKKLELYQELKSRNSRLGGDKAWNGEKQILRWSALEHRHLGTPIDVTFVEKNILTNRQIYSNFPADAERPMENLISKDYAKGTTSALLFLKEGLLMGEVIDDVANGKSWRYESIYWLAWAAAISGALIVIAPVARFIFLSIFHLLGWPWSQGFHHRGYLH